ncbi:hypothetical protein HDU85_005771 [Gaertneriomyces sp. JEL0708]|nr:hypothetical protein HDU85_005771 [Gaertneriomyces sp. JEL0708]
MSATFKRKRTLACYEDYTDLVVDWDSDGTLSDVPSMTSSEDRTVTDLDTDSDEDNDLEQFAVQSRLPPTNMSDEEELTWKHVSSHSDRKSYVRTRNYVLSCWLAEPARILSLETLRESTDGNALARGVQSSSHPFLKHAFSFLHRWRYINYGVLPTPLHAKERPATKKRPTVLIVGAGMSGLSAAREIANLYTMHPAAPQPVITIIEARKRVGGRVFTLPLDCGTDDVFDFDAALAQPAEDAVASVDLGAQIVTGFDSGNPLGTVILKQLGLPVRYLTKAVECTLYDHTGAVIDKKLDAECEEIFNDVLEKACCTIMHNGEPALVPDRTLRQAIVSGPLETDVPSLGEMFEFHLARHPRRPWLTHQELSIIHWHCANLEFANASPLTHLSLYHWDQDDPHEFHGEHSMIPGGYGQVAHAYAFGKSGPSPKRPSVRTTNGNQTGSTDSYQALDIWFGHIVTSISAYNTGVDIECNVGGETKILHGDLVVITTPLSVLKAKEIVFHPPLPAWKERAIDNLNMGHFNKLVMVFERRFWPAHLESFGSVATPENFPSPDYVASAALPHIRQPTLVAFTSPPGSTEQSTIAPETLAAKALRTLSRIFPHERPLPQPKQVIATTWDVDPYARGSYSSLGKAAHGDEYVVMSKREDGVGSRMIWAGEHTEGKWPATVHGALLSGMRAAREVADMLLGKLK